MDAGYRPQGEGLKGAIAWLAAGPQVTRERIEEAASRFQLSPLEAAVLFRYFSAECPYLYDEKQ